MDWNRELYPHIRQLTPACEQIVHQTPLLNIDNLVIPSPYIQHKTIAVDYEHSFVWEEKGELLGYLLVYATPDQKSFHIYNVVSSPFSRSKGIGSALLHCLAQSVPPAADIYLYIWEKLLSSIDFFSARGFAKADLIVFRKMRFLLMSVEAATLREKLDLVEHQDVSVVEELSRVRHDVKKSLRVLFDMSGMLAVENFDQVAENINRETISMLNTLNRYEDKIHLAHKVSFKELLCERVIPFIEAVDSHCEVRMVLTSKIDPVNCSYVACSRALINIVANALDAIKAAGRPGRIEFVLAQQGDDVSLSITDNGIGIAQERLLPGEEMLPLFVGTTTKGKSAGEGVGTRQVYETFGSDHIHVTSEEGAWTTWTIIQRKSTTRNTAMLDELSTRYVRLIKATQKSKLTPETSRKDVEIFIWQLRQMEVFSYDLLYHFSRYNNIRDIFQAILMYRYGDQAFSCLKEELRKCRIDNNSIRSWLLGMVRRIAKFETCLRRNLDFSDCKGVLFQSYGQVRDRTVIFTLDPESGNFFATDRKLAEHLDFVPYLQRSRDELLRGELVGDMRNIDSPISLGVWSATSLDDLHNKIALLRSGARQLLEMGLPQQKRIVFYNTTYNTCDYEIDTMKSTTVGELAALDEDDFSRLIRPADREMGGILAFD